MDYMTNRVNLCVYTHKHVISFVYLWIKNRTLQHLFYHFQLPWGIVTFGTFIFPFKRWFFNSLKQVEEIFSRMFNYTFGGGGRGGGNASLCLNVHGKPEVDYCTAQCTERIPVPGGANNKYTDFKGATGILSLTLVQHLSQLWVFKSMNRLLTVQLWTLSLTLFLTANRKR